MMIRLSASQIPSVLYIYMCVSMGPFFGLLLSRFKVILVDPVASSEDWEGGGGRRGAKEIWVTAGN